MSYKHREYNQAEKRARRLSRIGPPHAIVGSVTDYVVCVKAEIPYIISDPDYEVETWFVRGVEVPGTPV